MKRKVAVVANTTWYLYNFRLNLIRAFQDAGYEVLAIGPADKYVKRLTDAGVKHIPIKVKGDGKNPLTEILSVWKLVRVMRAEKIEFALSYTPKMNVYTAAAAKVTGAMVVPNISGLGGVFTGQTYLTILMVILYRLVLSWTPKVFFQNRDDMNFFLSEGIVDIEQALLIPGSGVDLDAFAPQTEMEVSYSDDQEFVFLVVARMLSEKGIYEYVEAARRIRAAGSNSKVRFQLLGPLATTNPTAIPAEVIQNWHRQGAVEYLGSVDDVRSYIRAAHCVVLASYYREGVPRSLLEAAAMAKPIVTTNSVGCRDTVDNGQTGFLCNPRDVDDLKEKMEQMIALSREERHVMGEKGRLKMEEEFDEKIVIARYLELVDSL
ncbi:MAG: glycosyltransferase family 4 protein [Pseudomonadota bacterium]